MDEEKPRGRLQRNSIHEEEQSGSVSWKQTNKNGEVKGVRPEERLIGGCRLPLKAICIQFWDGAISTGSE